MKADWKAATEEWAKEGTAWAEAVLVKTQHSSPRRPGARLAVAADGRMAGGVSMGCVENDLREHLLGILRGEGEERMVHYGVAFGESLEVGLSCGGEIDVWLRRGGNEEAEPGAGRRVMVMRLAPGGEAGYWREGEAVRPEWAGLEERIRRAAERGGTWCGEGWFVQGILPEPRVVITGASPIAVDLCALAARAGWRVEVVDPRRAFAGAERFPDAARVVHEWPEEGLEAVGIGPDDAVAVLAHDGKLDVPALAAALRAGCGYVGLLGSQGTVEARKAALREEGFGEEALGRIRGPIGLKALGGVEPAEIAVSILAELVQWRHRAGGVE